MKRWALVVASLYVLILAVFTVPFVLLAFTPKVSLKDAAEAYAHWQYWLWLGVMLLSQFALADVPHDAHKHIMIAIVHLHYRKVHRKHRAVLSQAHHFAWYTEPS